MNEIENIMKTLSIKITLTEEKREEYKLAAFNIGTKQNNCLLAYKYNQGFVDGIKFSLKIIREEIK